MSETGLERRLATEADQAAEAFYDRFGARRVTEIVSFRFDGDTLKDFAAGE